MPKSHVAVFFGVFALMVVVLVTFPDTRQLLGIALSGLESSFFFKTLIGSILLTTINTILAGLGLFVISLLRRQRVRGLSLPPGARLNVAIKFLYPKRTYERVFMTTISDMREEHAEALLCGLIWRARWVAIRGRCCLCVVVVMHAISALGHAMKKIWIAAG